MNQLAKSIRPFIGAKDFMLSKKFYNELGFEEVIIAPNMSYFKIFDTLGFYLQNAFVEDWVNNTMLFVEVDDVKKYYEQLESLQLPTKYNNVKLVPVKNNDWGSECFLHDPSNILWHFGAFKK